MSQRFDRPSRKDHVLAQYNNSRAATDYARANEGSRPESRFYRSRLRLVLNILADCPGGDLLDAGCGPGVLVHALLESRPRDFRITVLDQSPAMVGYCRERARGIDEVRASVGQIEAMPFADAVFDVTLAMGVLEYANARLAIGEISRATRPGGLVIVTMLNPLSFYRLTEWFLLRPFIRLLGGIERLCHVPAERRHQAPPSGIHAYPAFMLRWLMRNAALEPVDTIYFHYTPFVPPFDRLPRMRHWAERTSPGRTVTRGWRRWMCSAYLVSAKRSSPGDLTTLGALVRRRRRGTPGRRLGV